MIASMRQVRPGDVPALMQLDGSRPDDMNPGPGTLEAILIEADDCIVAYGALKLRAEVVVATNKNLPSMTRAHALKAMLDYAKRYVEKEEITSELYAFTSDSEFIGFIKKHFGFEEVPERSLVLDLRRASGT